MSGASAGASLAGKRGSNWASLATQDNPVPLTRPIRLECAGSEFRILGEGGRVESRIPIGTNTGDSIDPRVAPGTGTPKLGGLTYREAHLAMEMLADTRRVTSIEVVEVNPVLDDRNSTAELAVDLVESLFGKSTLMRK